MISPCWRPRAAAVVNALLGFAGQWLLNALPGSSGPALPAAGFDAKLCL